jgi:hypothetical protein
MGSCCPGQLSYRGHRIGSCNGRWRAGRCEFASVVHASKGLAFEA